MLSVRGITKSFSAPVLQSIDLTVESGQVVALLGANGAGKSTLSRIISGLVQPDQGEMTLDGRPFRPANKAAAENAGVQIVQQELNLIPTLSVAENLFLNRLPHHFGIVSRKKLLKLSHDALQQMDMGHIAPDSPLESLGVGQRQLIEIASAISRPCRVLILDEPTAALTASESSLLFNRIRRMQQRGIAVLYISHRLDEVREIADRSVVLRDGQLIASITRQQFDADRVVRFISGEEADRPFLSTAVPLERKRAEPTLPKPVMQICNLDRPPLVRNVSLTLFSGDCLGIAGLVGSGRTELLRCIFGADVADAGSVELPDRNVRSPFRHPVAATNAGIAMVTEERRHDGLLPSLSIRANTTLGAICQLTSGAINLLPSVFRKISHTKEETAAAFMQKKLQIQCHDLQQPVSELSGGNQQKVVISRWLLRNADIFLLDEPTRGIDAAARERIYSLLNELRIAGKAIIIVSSDLSELEHVCNRIAVMSAGRIVTEFSAQPFDKEAIMKAAFDGYRNQKPNDDTRS
ncbi:MAG: sugar ABC transporter ATP-binding protein [Planctomycetaceae bacterium]|nr:sugar ABC transporter ATP-binding protein [Planctomycetaceae bacterium]